MHTTYSFIIIIVIRHKSIAVNDHHIICCVRPVLPVMTVLYKVRNDFVQFMRCIASLQSLTTELNFSKNPIMTTKDYQLMSSYDSVLIL